MKQTKVPLNSSFAAISIIGLLLSLSFTVFGRIELKWGVTLIFFFLVMIISVMASIYPED
jgi:hypothetical protein